MMRNARVILSGFFLVFLFLFATTSVSGNSHAKKHRRQVEVNEQESDSDSDLDSDSGKKSKKNKKPRRFPLGCVNLGFAFQGQNVLLKPVMGDEQDPQTLYFIHNLSPYNIHFETVNSPEDIYAITYKTDIDSQRWAAFAFDKEQIIFSCSKRSSSEEQTPIDCSTAVDVCQFPCVRFAEHNGGNYFVSENLNMRETVSQANHGLGILLRWCPKKEEDEKKPEVPAPTKEKDEKKPEVTVPKMEKK